MCVSVSLSGSDHQFSMAICTPRTLLPCVSSTTTVTNKFSLRFSTGFRNSSFPRFFGSQVSGRVAFFAGGSNLADGEGREGCLALKNESRGGVGVRAFVKRSPKRLKYAAGGNRKASNVVYVEVDPSGSDDWKRDSVVELIKEGAVGVIPANTVIKNMDAKKPLSILCRSFQDIDTYTVGSPRGSSHGHTNVFRAARQCLPGPYTFVLPANKEMPKQCTNFGGSAGASYAPRKCVGVRMPDDEICKVILAKVDEPLVCTSVRRPADDEWMLDAVISADTYGAFEGKEGLDFVVDGGVRIADPSTVVDMTTAKPTLLRRGKKTTADTLSFTPGKSDLLVVGPGVLGSLVAQQWFKVHEGECNVVGQTNTTNRHEQLRSIGIIPVTKDTHKGETFPYVIFCGPPSGSEDYAAEVRAAAERWNGEGSLLFTSSSALYDVSDNGICDEETAPIVPKGAGPRTDRLHGAEEEVLKVGGSVVRLAGLYAMERGAHSYYLSQGTIAQRGDHIMNLIHYEDAASLCVTVLRGQHRGRIFLGCDNHPVSRQEIMDAVNKSGKYDKKFKGFTTTEGPLGKKMNNNPTRRATGWTPKYESFPSFLGVES